jgi:hypothetical protein
MKVKHGLAARGLVVLPQRDPGRAVAGLHRQCHGLRHVDAGDGPNSSPGDPAGHTLRWCVVTAVTVVGVRGLVHGLGERTWRVREEFRFSWSSDS